MKVVIAISHSFCANFIRGQARFLKSKGCDVTIVSASGPEISNVSQSEDTKLVEIPFSREISLTKDLKSLFSVIKFIKKEKPSIVNAGNPKTGFLFMLASVFFPKVPMIFTLRGLRSDTLTGFKKKVVFFTEKISCSLANKVIVISPSLMEHAIDLGVLKREKGIVLGKGSSNGVDTTKYSNSELNIVKGKDLRHQYQVDADDIIIGHVGRITKDKGIEEIYQGFKICQSTNNNIKLFLTGPIEDDDPISPEMMTDMQANESVYFLGKQDDVTGIYSAYDILVLYSYREGFGNVAIEASAMSKPVIVSDIPGARDTTEHMRSGLIVKPKSPYDLANAIQYYLDNPDKRIEHGVYGSKRINDFFASEVIWNGQLDLYKKMLKNKNQ